MAAGGTPTFRQHFRAALAVAFAGAAAVGALVAADLLGGFGGGAQQAWLGFGVALLPIILLAAYRWPAAVPFCFFAFAAPLDQLQAAGGESIGRLLGAASGVVIVLAMLIRRRFLSPPRAIWAWTAYGLWLIASSAWTLAPNKAVIQVSQFSALLALAAAIACTEVTAAEFRIILAAVVAGGLSATGYGIQLLLSGGMTPASQNSGRLNYGEIDANYLAASLLLPTLLCSTGALRSRSALAKAGWLVLTLALAVGILLSASRGGTLALGAGLVYLFFRMPYRKQLASVVASMGLVSLAIPVVWERFTDPTQGEASGRFEIWRVGLVAFKDHWLIGSGAGGWNMAFQDAFLRANLDPMLREWDKDSHNMLLEIGVEFGIIGVALVVAAAIYQLRSLRAIPKVSSLYDWRCAAEAAMCALIISSLSLPNVLVTKWAWLVFYFAYIVRGAWITSVHRNAGHSVAELEPFAQRAVEAR